MGTHNKHTERLPKQKIDGWLAIDKPLGMTSTQVGGFLKRYLRPFKIGHVGTLDPLASGVLVFALGEATKLIPYWTHNKKAYDFHITFGESRATLDAEGEIDGTSDHIPTKQDIIAILNQFEGVIEQTPPLYSAIHIDGDRAYDLARRGIEFDIPKRLVTIEKIKITGQIDERTFTFHVICQSGTYVRSLARDIALAVKSLGYVSFLRRTNDAPFSIHHIINLEKIEKNSDNIPGLLPLSFVLDDIPAITLQEGHYNDVCHGRSIVVCNSSLSLNESQDIPVIQLIFKDAICAIGRLEQGIIHPVRLIHS